HLSRLDPACRPLNHQKSGCNGRSRTGRLKDQQGKALLRHLMQVVELGGHPVACGLCISL
ncbi:hypothetical protein, partial [Amycolatopsis acidiphila]|uniref:hypothetical protein n=1 Tax=Amycolatopsis acidiphila TaxID=715473 RepID=UPI001C98A5CF